MRAIFLLCCLVGTAVQAEEAFICKKCTSEPMARQEALLYTPTLYCHSPSPDEIMTIENQVCYSTAKKVVLVNPDSKNIYVYSVSHLQAAPWSVQVATSSVTSQKMTDYVKAVDFYNDYNSAVTEAQRELNSEVAQYWASHSVSSSVGSLNDAAATCPSDTALDYFTDPLKLTALQDVVTLQLATGLKGSLNDYFQSGAQINSAGVSLLGAGINLGWSNETKKPVFIKSFSHSELPSSLDDTIIFDMDLVGFSASGSPQILFSLNDASRLAGYQLSALKGNFGALPITNACVLEKLQRLANSGQFRNPDGSASTFATNDYSGVVSGGGAMMTCRFDFFQSGRLLYVFIAPC